MAGWSRQKRLAFEKAFYAYLDHCEINSKDHGEPIILGQHLMYGQKVFITAIFDGLEQDIHDFYCLKSRQLGITTIIRALCAFFLGVHRGLTGALVFDTNENKNLARDELVTIIKALPASLKFPGIAKDNRDGLTLANASKILFKSAGIKKTKTSGTLGRSAGVSLAHLSELCSYDNEEGLVSFQESLSDVNPNRLYIRESTARGMNMWSRIWKEARKNVRNCVCVFIGWWAKDSHRIERDDKNWEFYGAQPPTSEEQAKIDIVKKLYDFDVCQEQLAWYRKAMDPSALDEDEVDAGFEASSYQKQEQPWDEEEAFQITGSVFFAGEKLKDQTDKWVSRKFTPYMFMGGSEFSDMKVYKAENTRMIELKVWEPPQPESVYVIGTDPAFGENENNDRSAIEVFRCYADGIDQVAEYAYPLVVPRHLAHILAGIMAWYGNEPLTEVHHILEINGPGGAVLQELKSLKFQIENGYAPLEEQGIKNIFRNVKQYLYSRPDSLSGGSGVWHFKCLFVDELIPTPSGWTTMKELNVGDEIFDDQGKACRVIGCSPVMANHECFEVTFEDGSTIIADDQHLWPVQKGALVETTSLMDARYSIACTEPLELPTKALPIDPYVLGVWLGDGQSVDNSIFGAEADLLEISEHIKFAGYELNLLKKDKPPRTVCRRSVIGLKGQLQAYNLLRNKHIPKEYLRASKEQRLALLQGLMDTDGSIDISKQCGFVTTLPEMAKGFKELLRSLGIKPKFLIKNMELLYKGKMSVCKPAYQFWFTAYPEMIVFKLKRKANRQLTTAKTKGRQGTWKPKRSVSKRHRVVSVEPIGSVPVRCISVDSPSHLYLAGVGMIPTHNTQLQTKIMIMEELRGVVGSGLLHIRSHDLIEEMQTIARDGDTIEGDGSGEHDDRVIASALANHYWDTRIRRNLIVQKRTREAERVKKHKSAVDQTALFNQNMMAAFMGTKVKSRVQAQQLAMKQAWRYGRR